MPAQIQAGLREVVAATSRIADVDGAAGTLRYQGYDIADLAANAAYEEVVALLWDGDLPSPAALDALTAEIKSHRLPPSPVLTALEQYPRTAHPLEVLRAGLATAAMYDPDARAGTGSAHRRIAVRVVAHTATLVAAWARIRTGATIVAPDSRLPHAANFLWMLTGDVPEAAAAEAMDAVLVLHAEHELNASTFVARVVTATVSDLYSSIIAALGALKGPRHGGANEDVLSMLETIGTPERAAPFIHARLQARAAMTREERADPRNRIPGWGHPVYRVHDPRAARLRALAHRTAAVTGTTVYADIAEEIYRVMAAETDLPVNVDFFSAVIYRALGIPIDLCTSIFAVSRVAGWCAHIMEQFADNRLIRPRAQYVGPARRPFVPLAARGQHQGAVTEG
jgi:citrate synthase